MLLSRKIGAVLRGKATPRQVMMATALGGLLGFVPGFFLPADLAGGFRQAPGLILSLLFAVLVLNANLAVFGLVLMVAKLASFALLPISYAAGVWLLDGPLRGLFAAAIEAPVTAWFGLEYYATTGGLLLGGVFGIGAGAVLNLLIRTLRARMAGLEENSARYQQLVQRRWVRLLAWLLLGSGKGKTTWRELSESRKKGLPVRLAGVLLVAVLISSLLVFQTWFSAPVLTTNLKAALERANGATVDVAAAELSLAAGTLRIERLAIADPKALDQDLLAADLLVARVDTGELLRRRLVIDELRSTNARTGSRRSTPGHPVTRPEPPPAPPAPPAGQKTIDDYLEDFALWRDRFEQAREWIDLLTGADDTTPLEPSPAEIERERRIQEQAGLARVVATHLVARRPRLLIRRIDVEGIGCTIGGEAHPLDLRLRNVSDRPKRVPDMLSVALTTPADKFALQLTGPAAAGSRLGMTFAVRRLPVDSVLGGLRLGGAPPLRGGTMDLSATGGLDRFGQTLAVDLPLQVQLRDTTFAFAGSKPTPVESLLLPIGLSGPLQRPAVSFDDRVLRQALLAAGQRELADFVQQHAGKLVGALPAELQGLVDPTRPLDANLDAARQQAAAAAEAARLQAEQEKQRLEEEAKRKAAEEAKKRLPGLKGVLPGGKSG